MSDETTNSEMTATVAEAVAKIDRAIQLLDEELRKNPHNRNAQMAKASLESARMELVGERVN